MNKRTIIEQTSRAFEFIQKLYFEVSYLVKEVEGLLAEEKENFIIGRPRGYQITWRSSSGLEPVNVRLWLMRKFSVFFVPEEKTKSRSGMTITRFSGNLQVIYLRFILDDNDLAQPIIMAGVLQNFELKDDWGNKFEKVMTHLEYRENQMVINNNRLSYEDSHLSFEGEVFQVNLYDINSGEDIEGKVIRPVLNLFRGKNSTELES